MIAETAEWEIAIFEGAAPDSSGQAKRFKIAGWVKGPFALDPRRYTLSNFTDETAVGWVITHLPTGYVVRGVKGSLPEAQKAADALLANIKWEFDDPGHAPKLAIAVNEIAKLHPALTNTSHFDQPLWLNFSHGETA